MPVLSIDQGTTGTTAAWIDDHGDCQNTVNVEFTQIYPQPGWVEHDPLAIWSSVQQAVKTLLAKGFDPTTLNAVSITNQRETIVAWERQSGAPLHNAIVWQCKRTASACTALAKAGYSNDVRRITGLPIDAYFSASKIAWMLEQVDGLRQRAMRGEVAFGTIDSWLLYKLTGHRVHLTDYTNASRTLLFDIDRLDWSDEMCALFSVPRAALPQVQASASQFGHTVDCGFLPDGIPIAGVAGDQQAALFGQGCIGAGTMKNTYGTGCFLLMNTAAERVDSQHGLLTTLACGPTGQPCYALEGAVFVAGAAIQWLRDELKVLSSAAQSEACAMAVGDNGGVYMVPAFSGLGTPHWDMDAQGAIVGLTRGSNRNHVIRAALEAMAYQSKEVVDVMMAESGLSVDALNVDGGATANNFLMQFQADICRFAIARPANVETTALGSAYLAGMTVGLWDADSLFNQKIPERVFRPQMGRAAAAVCFHGYQRAVRRVLLK